MCFVLAKVSVINITVCVVPYSFSMHLSLHKFSFVSAEVWPFHYSVSLKLVFYKLTNIDFAAVSEIILACSMKLALYEVSLVCWSLEFEFTFSRLLTLLEVTFILYAVEIPELKTMTVLEIIFPLSFVEWALIIAKDTFSMCFSVIPLALVNIPISMSHPTYAMKKSILGLALILRFIWEYYCAESSPFYFGSALFIPMAYVHSTITNIIGVIIPSEVLVRIVLKYIV